MKKILVAFALAGSASAQVLVSEDFTAGSYVFTGSWTDNRVHPQGFLEIGPFGTALDTGSFSRTFAPVDFTHGYGGFGDFRTFATVTNSVPNPNYDPNFPVGPFNQPTLAVSVSTVQTGGEVVREPYAILNGARGNDETWQLTILDANNQTAIWNVEPAPLGAFWNRAHTFTGAEIDWTQVVGWQISGDGTGGVFSAGFNEMMLLNVPEPEACALFSAIALAGFAAWRPRT